MSEFLTPPVATITASFIAATLGSWLAARAALGRFRHERAFDQQTQWYVRMVRALHDMATHIEVAITFQRESGTPSERLEKCWGRVRMGQLELDSAVTESSLYGTEAVRTTCRAVSAAVQAVAERTEVFTLSDVTEDVARRRLKLIEPLTAELHAAAEEIATHGRRHLGLGR